jgi:hypothetical protein
MAVPRHRDAAAASPANQPPAHARCRPPSAFLSLFFPCTSGGDGNGRDRRRLLLGSSPRGIFFFQLQAHPYRRLKKGIDSCGQQQPCLQLPNEWNRTMHTPCSFGLSASSTFIS